VGAARLAVSPRRGRLRLDRGSLPRLRRQRSRAIRRTGGRDGGGPGAICGTAGQVARGETPASHTVTNRKLDRGWGPDDGAMRHRSLMCM